MNSQTKVSFTNIFIFLESFGHNYKEGYKKGSIVKNHQKLFMLLDEYKSYKEKFARNIKFNPKSAYLSKYNSNNYFLNSFQLTLDQTLKFPPLKLVRIYFDTATYDEIERDVKITLEAQLGLIGGTMGLLTGFSILSGVEILYFCMKLFMSFRTYRNDLHAGALSREIGSHIN